MALEKTTSEEIDDPEVWFVDLDRCGVAELALFDDDNDAELTGYSLVVGIFPKDKQSAGGKTHLICLDDNEAAELGVLLLELVAKFRAGTLERP